MSDNDLPYSGYIVEIGLLTDGHVPQILAALLNAGYKVGTPFKTLQETGKYKGGIIHELGFVALIQVERNNASETEVSQQEIVEFVTRCLADQRASHTHIAVLKLIEGVWRAGKVFSDQKTPSE